MQTKVFNRRSCLRLSLISLHEIRFFFTLRSHKYFPKYILSGTWEAATDCQIKTNFIPPETRVFPSSARMNFLDCRINFSQSLREKLIRERDSPLVEFPPTFAAHLRGSSINIDSNLETLTDAVRLCESAAVPSKVSERRE